MVKGNRIKKKSKLKIKAVLVLFIFLILIGSVIYGLLSIPITNIYVSGNKYLSEQEIIDLAGLSNYPSSIKAVTFLIKNKLEKNNMILDASVIKKKFTKVYIYVAENYPLYYYDTISKTVLYDGTEADKVFNAPIVINYITDTVYNNFKDKMKSININILSRISEIKYDPNTVDDERFLFMMNDGNYVYITLSKFDSINNYIEIIKNIGSKKGILYLDSGEYFKVLD